MGNKIGVLGALVAIGLLSGCAAQTQSAGGEAAQDTTVLAYLKGSWACAATMPDTEDVVTLDFVIDGNSLSATPSEGYGDPVTLNFAAKDGTVTFDEGVYVEVPESMPPDGERLDLTPSPPDGVMGLTSVAVTREGTDSAVLSLGSAQTSLDYACTRD